MEEKWEADRDAVRVAGEPAAEAVRLRPDRTEAVSVPSADVRNHINAVCPASSESARTAGP